MKRLLFILLGVISLQGLPAQNAPQPYRLIKTIPVEGDGFWDYLIADNASLRLYISHGTCVQVLDLKTEKLAGTISGTPGVHGIALVTVFGKGFISVGKVDSVIVFNLSALKILTRIPTGKKPDAIVYDPFTQRVFCFNGEGNSATVIDAKTDEVVGTVALPGNPEMGVPDGSGKMFVNIEDLGEIVKFDATTLKVEATWPLSPGKGPTGLAYDPVHKRLFSACRETNMLVILDAVYGKMIEDLPIGEGCDGVVFVPSDQNIVTANGAGTMTVIHQTGPKDYSVVQTVETRKSARTLTYDPTTEKFYLSSADVTMEGGKRQLTPGSFQILVVGK
jgi:DNA-binding beta-propeller fold protein YncE